MKRFFDKKGLKEYLSLACFLLSLLALVLYITLGKNEFNKEISLLCVIPGFIAVFLFLLAFLHPLVFVSEFASFFLLFSFVSYIGSQANYIANVFTAIDGSSISLSFVFTFVSFLLSFLVSIVLLFFKKKDVTQIEIISSDKKEAEHE